MSHHSNKKGAIASIAALAFAAIAISSCNSSGGSAGEDAGTVGTPIANVPIGTVPPADTGNIPSGLVTPSCVTSDSNHICLAVHFVSYKDSNGTPVVNESQLKTIMSTMNSLFAQCGIGFQVEKYEQVDPTAAGLSYGANSQNELDQIRNTYGNPSNMLLGVNTGPWGTSVNAWTNMPGSGPYGAIMESSIVGYGDGIIHAHEFGHYLGLDHVSDQSDLMNPVIYTSSTTLTSDQCATARDAAANFWSAMVRH
jgi:hypothetical protein